MGGFRVNTQPFRIYQGIDWICDEYASLHDQINGVRRIREMIEEDKTEDVVRLGIPSRLVELLEKTTEYYLQSEIVWALSNIAAGTSSQTAVVLRKGLQVLLNLFEDPDCPFDVKTDVVWAFSNIAGDCAEFRDKLLELGIMEKLLEILKSSPVSYEFEKISVWLISNLCRHKNPLPKFRLVRDCIPFLMDVLREGKPEIITNALWALKYLADGPEIQVNLMIYVGVCDLLVNIIENGDPSNTVGALLVCINISSGVPYQTRKLIEAGIIPTVIKLLGKSRDRNVLRNIAFLVSNIAADDQIQIDVLIKSEIFLKLAKTFFNSDHQTQLEVLRAIENASLNGRVDQIIYLTNVTDVLHSALTMDQELSKIALRSLFNIASAQKSKFQALTSVTKVNSQLYKLKNDENEEIALLASILANLL